MAVRLRVLAPILALGGLSWGCGGATLAATSALAIDCPEDEVAVTDDVVGHNAQATHIRWTAACRDKAWTCRETCQGWWRLPGVSVHALDCLPPTCAPKRP